MNNINVFTSLSSQSRLDILKCLSFEPKGVNDLAKAIGLKPITIRHHVQDLMQAGLIEEFKEVRGTSGRPKICYKIRHKGIMISFPKRDYTFLSEILVEGVQSLLGEKEAGKLFSKVGEQMGIAAIKKLENENKIKEWTAETFGNIFVKGMLNQAGTEPEIVDMKENEIVFREHNCVFLEIAEKNPRMICDSLDKGFHNGIIKCLNSAKGNRTKCMGHGDSCCEYSVVWSNKH